MGNCQLICLRSSRLKRRDSKQVLSASAFVVFSLLLFLVFVFRFYLFGYGFAGFCLQILTFSRQTTTGLPKPKNQSRKDGSYKRNKPVIRMADGKTIRASFATKRLGFHGIKVFSSMLKLDVTAIERMVSVLVAIARLALFVLLVLHFCVFWSFYCCALFDMCLFSYCCSCSSIAMTSDGPAASIATQAREQLEPIKCPTLRTRSSSTSTSPSAWTSRRT